MHKLSSLDAQQKCHWLALAGSLLAVSVAITLTLLCPSGSRASYSSDVSDRSSLRDTFQSPHQCHECHEREFQAWSGTTHADASFDPVFQVDLQCAQRPGECYACHTTGYDSISGQFALAGVTCEACHGPYQEGHSGEGMLIVSPEQLCGACHIGTLAAWTSSRHGKANVSCTACHEVHSQKPHSADNTNTLCAGCHQDQIQDPTHSPHNDAGVTCITCHLTRVINDEGAAAKGQASTGHAFAVYVKNCDDCHPTPIQP